MTYVINQGLALYWGTSRWSAAEIMVCNSDSPPHTSFPFLVTSPNLTGLRSKTVEGLL